MIRDSFKFVIDNRKSRITNCLDPLERRQARVLPGRGTVARSGVQVRAAMRTEALAVVPAQWLHRHRQVELLTYEIVEIDLLVAVVAGLEIVVRHFGLEL